MINTATVSPVKSRRTTGHMWFQCSVRCWLSGLFLTNHWGKLNENKLPLFCRKMALTVAFTVTLIT